MIFSHIYTSFASSKLPFDVMLSLFSDFQKTIFSKHQSCRALL